MEITLKNRLPAQGHFVKNFATVSDDTACGICLWRCIEEKMRQFITFILWNICSDFEYENMPRELYATQRP